MESAPGQTVVEIPLLATKLHVPGWRGGLVSRPRLVAALDRGAEHALTLVSAPAGFGKTTLLAEWLATSPAVGRPAAWVSLEPDDSDPVRFWAYVAAALRAIQPGLGAMALSLLRSTRSPSIEGVLTTLINELASLADDVVLVLDDFHAIDARSVQDAIAFLIEHRPPRLHLVISTREDPQLPLARLRARDQLTELRAADLRFTAAEAAEFLQVATGLDLSAADVAALEERTEGWIAGLQLAALSMRGREDIPEFVRAFAGTHRYVVDYLVDEVLRRQPEPVRDFLFQTAILDRLHGSLCDAVTGQEGGATRLETLERGNFFVVSLDDTRRWYRYHHLFADVLRARLLAEQPDVIPTLHRRASVWHEAHGSVSDAIRHALAGEDVERSASLVERAAPAMLRGRQEATLLGWLRVLPDELLRYRPLLSAQYASVLLGNGEIEGVERRLRDAERWLDSTAGPQTAPDAKPEAMVVVDEEEFRRLPGAIAMYRAGLALALGDVPATEAHARRALDLAPEDDHLRRGGAAAILGLAAWTSGDLEAAHRAYADGMDRLRTAGNVSDAVGGVIALADIRIAQGRLREAMDSYRQALRLATDQGPPDLRGTADMHVGLADLFRERNDLDAATRHLLTARELGEHAGFPQYPYRWRVAMARIRAAGGDLAGAIDLLDEAERRYVGDFYPNVRPVAAVKARVQIAQGRVDDVLAWARGQGLSPEDELTYLREFAHVTLAKALVARYEHDRDDRSLHRGVRLLERLLVAAEAGGRTGSAIDILVQQALAYRLGGDLPAALARLERALALAEPEGYVRIFVDEGPPMATMLEAAAKRGIAPSYARRLLAAFGTAGVQPPADQGLTEPLSERELDVLRLLRTDLTGPEIAHELMVSLNTMRTHTKNIYAKLGVNSRRAAIRQAEERGLLPRTGSDSRLPRGVRVT